MRREVAIIGAGIGGIATSIILTQKGYKVTVFEKNSYPGGRCSNFVKKGHRFDIGATMIMMPEIYEKYYALIGKSFREEFELFRMDPTYNIMFNNGRKFLFTSDLSRMKTQLESFETGSYRKFLKFMHKTSVAFRLSIKYFIARNFNYMTGMVNFKNLFLLFKVNAHRKYYPYISRIFKDEALRFIFTLQNLYIGQNPLTASAVFAGLPYMELTDGVWFPKGGMNSIAENLLNIAIKGGVKFNFSSAVKEIKTHNKIAEGIILNDKTFFPADIIISNADLPYIYNNMLPEGILTKRMNMLNYTCSAVVFHWGVDKVYPQLEQHNLFVAENYKKGIHKVFKEKTLPEEQTFYIHSPVRSDKSAAPKDQDSLTVIVQVGNLGNKEEQNWNMLKKKARKGILERLKKEGLSDLEEHIKFEVCYLPKTWETLFNLSKGAAFGSISHNLLQMGYFRPHNKHYNYKNLYFTGGSTQPGSGIPLVLLSAILTSEQIIQNDNPVAV